MKDYTFSEVAQICLSKQTVYNDVVYYDCNNCELLPICMDTKLGSRIGEMVVPRDILDLPCKIELHINTTGVTLWQVIYKRQGVLNFTKLFTTEEEADKFLVNQLNKKPSTVIYHIST